MNTFVWEWKFGRRVSGTLWLKYGEIEVCRLERRAPGVWVAFLYRLPAGLGATTKRDCTSFEAGQAGCIAWAERHRAAIEAYARVEAAAAAPREGASTRIRHPT